jgi:hypothetical protein
MFEYHGWFTSTKDANADEIEDRLKELNNPYPVSVDYVNGQLHISFSGNPNRELNYINTITEYLLGLNLKIYGIIYINDANTDRYDKFDIVKIVDDKKYTLKDSNFSIEDTRLLFE